MLCLAAGKNFHKMKIGLSFPSFVSSLQYFFCHLLSRAKFCQKGFMKLAPGQRELGRENHVASLPEFCSESMYISGFLKNGSPEWQSYSTSGRGRGCSEQRVLGILFFGHRRLVRLGRFRSCSRGRTHAALKEG